MSEYEEYEGSQEGNRSDIIKQFDRQFEDSYRADRDYINTLVDWNKLYCGAHFVGRDNVYDANEDYYSYNKATGKSSLNDQSQKRLQIKENRIQPVVDFLVNYMISYCGDISFKPFDDEPEDKVLARCYRKVYKYLRKSLNLDSVKSHLALVGAINGECAVEVTWNPDKGFYMGDDQSGDPVFSGGFDFNFLNSASIRRPLGVKRLEDGEWLGYEEMMSKEDLLGVIESSSLISREMKAKFKRDIKARDFRSFVYSDFNDFSSGIERNSDFLRRIYYKPCLKYPRGKMATWYSNYLLEYEDLPEIFNGKLPIFYYSWKTLGSYPRGHSVIDNLKDSQVELNRVLSRISEIHLKSRSKIFTDATQGFSKGTTISDADVVTASGGGGINGQTSFNYVPGDDGSRFVPIKQEYLNALRELSNVTEGSDQPLQADLLANLYRSSKEKYGYLRNFENFAGFWRDIVEFVIQCSKYYLEDYHLAEVLSDYEVGNMGKFRENSFMEFDVDVRQRANDPDSIFMNFVGKQTLLQYTAKHMDPATLSSVIASMPLADLGNDVKEIRIMEDIYDNILTRVDDGDMSALQAVTEQIDPHRFIGKVSLEMLKPSFEHKSEEVKQIYMQLKQMLEQLIQKIELQKQQSELSSIPVNGPLMKVRGYIVPNEKGSSKEVALPSGVIEWVLNYLNQIGLTQERISVLDEQARSQVAEQLKSQAQAVMGVPQGGPQGPQGG